MKEKEVMASLPAKINYEEIDEILLELSTIKDKIGQEDRKIIEYIRRVESSLADLPFVPDEMGELSLIGQSHEELLCFIDDDEYGEDVVIHFQLLRRSHKKDGGWRLGFCHDELDIDNVLFIDLPMPIIRRYAPSLSFYLHFLMGKIRKSFPIARHEIRHE